LKRVIFRKKKLLTESISQNMINKGTKYEKKVIFPSRLCSDPRLDYGFLTDHQSLAGLLLDWDWRLFMCLYFGLWSLMIQGN
jgi:hypothetical protein